MVQYESNAPGFQAESGRFDTDFCAEERRRRNQVYANLEKKYDRMREQNIERDERRYRMMDEEAKKKKEYLDYLRDKTTKAKKNESGIPYDPVTLRYNDGYDGIVLKNEEENIKYRVGLRAQHLQFENNRNGYNPITGEPIRSVNIPQRPDPLPPEVYNSRKR